MTVESPRKTAHFVLVDKSDGFELDLEPLQGLWTEEQYLKLTDSLQRLVEFTDGEIAVLPVPTDKHQALSQFLFLALVAFLQQVGGKVQYAPLRL